MPLWKNWVLLRHKNIFITLAIINSCLRGHPESRMTSIQSSLKKQVREHRCKPLPNLICRNIPEPCWIPKTPSIPPFLAFPWKVTSDSLKSTKFTFEPLQTSNLNRTLLNKHNQESKGSQERIVPLDPRGTDRGEGSLSSSQGFQVTEVSRPHGT